MRNADTWRSRTCSILLLAVSVLGFVAGCVTPAEPESYSDALVVAHIQFVPDVRVGVDEIDSRYWQFSSVHLCFRHEATDRTAVTNGTELVLGLLPVVGKWCWNQLEFMMKQREGESGRSVKSTIEFSQPRCLDVAAGTVADLGTIRVSVAAPGELRTAEVVVFELDGAGEV